MMLNSPHILIADDERSIRLMLETGLMLNGFRVTCARTGKEALEAVRQYPFDAIISDIYMPDGDGVDVVRELRGLRPDLPIILMTAQGSLDLAVRAVAEGASDFIAKPFEVASIAAMLRRSIEARREAEATVTGENASLVEEFSRSGLIGRSPAMARVYKLIAHAARTEATVLVTGESGTGKELVARAIHNFSARADKPFVAINCSGLTDTLLEAELFGYTKGAFTGATGDHQGLFDAANGGTIFLDELASTSPALQSSLLRVLQFGEVRPVGSTQTHRVNVRIIGASNAPLRELAETGKFRADLFYRLSVLTIELPLLRERTGDVELLTRHFLRRGAEPRASGLRISQDALDLLCAYEFPGNVRELENAVVYAAALCSNGCITADALPEHIAARAQTNSICAAVPDPEDHLVADRPSMDELQRRYLQLVLSEVQGNRRRAAETLGLNRRTIQRLLARYKMAEAEDADEGDEDQSL
jgi:DNA-binding NtrC family response regulator